MAHSRPHVIVQSLLLALALDLDLGRQHAAPISRKQGSTHDAR